MAEHYRFFDSTPEDERKYNADDFAEYFRQFLSSGVYHVDEDAGLKVSATGTDMQSYVQPGGAFLEGYMYRNTDDLYLEHNAAHGSYDRIDRVVIRLDRNPEERKVEGIIKSGTPDSSPTPPSLIRDAWIYEISLAQVLIPADTSVINPDNITDERYEEDVCGLVSSLITVPVSEFEEAWNSWWSEDGPDDMEADWNSWWNSGSGPEGGEPNGMEYQWNDWFTGRQSEWDTWFTETQDEWDTWFDGVQEESYITGEEFNDHSSRHENNGDDEINLEDLNGESTELKNHKDDIASGAELGHVKVGNNLSIDGDGKLNAEAADAIPSGIICMWSGSIANVPSGWALCNGENGTPDLRDRFIVCAGNDYGVGDTGGQKEVQLNESEMPSHNHSNPDTGIEGSHAHSNPDTDSAGNHTHGNPSTTSAGSHSHGNPSTGSVGDHSHSNPNTSSTGSHSHSSGTLSASTDGDHSHSITTRRMDTEQDHKHTFSSLAQGPDPGDTQVGAGTTIADGDHSHDIAGSTGSDGSHSHSIDDTGDAGSHSHSMGNTYSGGSHSHSMGDTYSGGSHSHSMGNTHSAGNHSHSIDDTGSTGGGEAHENRPPYYALAFIMKF